MKYNNSKGENRGQENNHGRTASYPTTPVQIPACGITAPGSSELLASHLFNTEILRNHGKSVV